MVLVEVVRMIDKLKAWGAIAAAIALGALLAAQTIRLNSEQLAHANARATHSQFVADIASKTQKAAKAVRDYETAVNATLAQADAKHTRELSDANKETNRLRACVRAGTCGVRIIAAPSQPNSAMPSDSSPCSLGDGSANVTGEVAERVFDLRDAVERDTRALEYLQDYAKACYRSGVEAGEALR